MAALARLKLGSRSEYFPKYENLEMLHNNRCDVIIVKNIKNAHFIGHFREEIGKNLISANQSARIN